MGQIVGLKAKPKRCNLNALGSVPTPAAGEHILVSYDNSMTANGQGNFDRYIIGDGRTAAAALELKYLDDSTRPYIVEEVNKAVADIQPIEITGDVTNAPDEEDLTSENQGGTDVLKFKDKAYNSALYSGLGRTYLRKNITDGKNVLTQSMVNTANTIYHIQYDYDLNGQTITLPAGCVLEFDGGSLANGTIKTPYTLANLSVIHYENDLVYNHKKVYEYGVNICGLSYHNFRNLKFDGLFITNKVSHLYFSGYANDTDLLGAMLDLGMPSDFQCVIELEPNKTYNVTSALTEYSASIYQYEKSANKTLCGNGATINDQRTMTFFANAGSYVAVIGLWQCSNISIQGLNYTNLNDDYPVGIVYSLNQVGAAFIHTFLDCENIDVDINVYGARYGFIHGEFSNFWWCGDNGLTHSKIVVNAETTGYPLVVQIGSDLELWTHSELDHRSNYIMGVTNSKIYVESKNHYTAPIHLLVGDFRYSGEYETTKYKEYGDLDITFVDLGTTINDGQNADGTTYTPDAYCVGFTLWGDNLQAGRDFPLSFRNVNAKVHIPSNSVTGALCFVRGEGNAQYPQSEVSDTFENFHFVVEANNNNTIGRIVYASHCYYNDVDFEFIGGTSTGGVYALNNNANYIEIINSAFSGNFVVKGNVSFDNCAVGAVTPLQGEVAYVIKKKTTGTFDTTINVISDFITPVNLFPLSSALQNIKGGAIVPRISGGCLININRKWYSIPLYPFDITNATLQTKALATSGATSARPGSASSVQKGLPFFDITLLKPIWQNGYGWVEADGEDAGILRSGTTAQRPTPRNVGFRYFDEDLSKPIFYTGTGWVDATGAPADNSLVVLSISQSDYDALVTKDANTLYVIS